MTLEVEKLHHDFGAKILALDLRTSLTPEVASDIRQALDEYSLLHFPAQQFDDELHLALTRALGTPEENHLAKGEEGRRTYFGTIGNVQADGSKLGNEHRKTKFLTGNNLWHTDSSFRPVPAFFSINCVYETPTEGGVTEFVSARAAYERLATDEQTAIDELIVVHDYVFSRSKVAPDAVSESLAKSLPPAKQKLVRTNPDNGRKNYYLGSHAKTIDGWDFDKSRELIDDLQSRATQAEYVYAHHWQPKDVVIWDNRCLLHRGTGYDADKYRRYMRQTRVAGLCPTLRE